MTGSQDTARPPVEENESRCKRERRERGIRLLTALSVDIHVTTINPLHCLWSVQTTPLSQAGGLTKWQSGKYGMYPGPSLLLPLSFSASSYLFVLSSRGPESIIRGVGTIKSFLINSANLPPVGCKPVISLSFIRGLETNAIRSKLHQSLVYVKKEAYSSSS